MTAPNSKVVLLNIGSNLGNRRLNLSRAVSALEKVFGYFEISHTIESKPHGYQSNNDFLNLGMMARTDLEPLEILAKIKEIEKAISPADSHRNPDGSYADRVIDIDIIAIDDMVLESAQLTIPHPKMHLRSFVLEPLVELAPGWVHPVLNATPAQLLENLK